MEKEIEVKLFEIINDYTILLSHDLNLPYLECLFLTSRDILEEKTNSGIVDTEEAENLIFKIKELEFQREHIRRALVACTLNGCKRDRVLNSELTPDTTCLLVSYIVNFMIKKQKKVSILDPVVGFGNLLSTVLTGLGDKEVDVFGIDSNLTSVQIARVFMDMQEFTADFIIEDAIKSSVSGFDLIVGDLPLYLYDNHYFPHVIVNRMIDKLNDTGRAVFVVPNDFFDIESEFKSQIIDKANLEGLVKLPDDLFIDKKLGKSILLLSKKNVKMNGVKNFLLVELPSLTAEVEFKKSVKTIEKWFKEEEK